jgi:UDP-2,3-diacylglucosamine hydrolase
MGTSLAILAGGGRLPRHLAKACRDQGHDVHIVAFDGHTDPATVQGFSHLWAPLGQAAPVLDWLRSQGVTDIVFFGPLRRPSLTELRPDWRAARFFAKAGLRALGDDGLMRAVARTLEVEEGFRVRGAHEFWTSVLLPVGPLGELIPDADAEADIRRGMEVLRLLGPADVGQAVVVQQGLVLGVEAIEGTDAMIDRCGDLRRPGPGGVLVKLPKAQQDRRLDMPTIGPVTVERAAAAGLRGIAAGAGATIVADRPNVIDAADRTGLFVVGIDGA